MNIGKESNVGVTPAKQPKTKRGNAKPVVEGRPVTEENNKEPDTQATQRGKRVSQGLLRIKTESCARSKRRYMETV